VSGTRGEPRLRQRARQRGAKRDFVNVLHYTARPQPRTGGKVPRLARHLPKPSPGGGSNAMRCNEQHGARPRHGRSRSGQVPRPLCVALCPAGCRLPAVRIVLGCAFRVGGESDAYTRELKTNRILRCSCGHGPQPAASATPGRFL
jgi:hypothetical protein